MHLGLEGMPETADRMVAFYGRRFEGGCSLITTGGISINHAGKGSNIFFNFQKEEDCVELSKVNKALKNKGILCAQLFHAGRYAYHRDLVGPSPIRAPINRFVPHELTEEEAWKMVTLNPAKMLHLDGKLGSIAIGKDADLVLWSDNPLSIYAKPEMTFVDGICYYSLAQDQILRNEIKAERQRIINKMIGAKLAGEKTEKKISKIDENYHCED
jgi:adenine deaminase